VTGSPFDQQTGQKACLTGSPFDHIHWPLQGAAGASPCGLPVSARRRAPASAATRAAAEHEFLSPGKATDQAREAAPQARAEHHERVGSCTFIPRRGMAETILPFFASDAHAGSPAVGGLVRPVVRATPRTSANCRGRAQNCYGLERKDSASGWRSAPRHCKSPRPGGAEHEPRAIDANRRDDQLGINREKKRNPTNCRDTRGGRQKKSWGGPITVPPRAFEDRSRGRLSLNCNTLARARDTGVQNA
jgi:hypothetical protein